MNSPASQKAKTKRLEELRDVKAILLECAREQERLRQAITADRTSRELTPAQYAGLFRLGHTRIREFEERIHAIGGRGPALESLCQHLATNTRPEHRATAAYYAANSQRIVELHNRVPSDKMLGITIFSSQTIEWIFTLHENWIRTELTRSEFACFFDASIRDIIMETLSWNTQTIQTWSQDPPTKTPPTDQEAICSFMQILEDLKMKQIDFRAYRDTLREQRAQNIRAIRLLWSTHLQPVFHEKKALREAMQNPHEATFTDLLGDKDPLEVAELHSAKTIQAWLQKFTACTQTPAAAVNTPERSITPSKGMEETPPAVSSPRKIDDSHLQTEDADTAGDVWVHLINGMRSLADHAQVLARRLPVRLPPASQHQAKIAIMRFCRILGIEPHTLVESQHGQPMDKKTIALLGQ